MIALQVTAAQVALAGVALLGALVVVWRWPGLVLGVSAALALWTVHPAAAWVALLVAMVAAVTWWRVAPGRRVCWPGARWLARRPPLAALVVSAALAGAGPEAVAPWAFVVLVAAAGWLAWTWPATEGPAADVRPVVGDGERRLTEAASGAVLVAGDVVVRRSGPCPHCGGRLVAELRVPADPAGMEDLVAHAGCRACGSRLVGVVDPARPQAGLVWLPLPDIDGPVGRASGGEF